MGLALVAIGATMLWSAWALVVVGVVLMAVPEIVSAVRQRRIRADYLRAVADGRVT
jgi:uncharacterized membrane protein